MVAAVDICSGAEEGTGLCTFGWIEGAIEGSWVGLVAGSTRASTMEEPGSSAGGSTLDLLAVHLPPLPPLDSSI